MLLNERIHFFQYIFDSLQETTSLNIKKQIVSEIPEELQDDWKYILEILNGEHKLGYTFTQKQSDEIYLATSSFMNKTIKEYFQPLYYPAKYNDYSREFCGKSQWCVRHAANFIEPIVNRKLRLGIGQSLLDKKPTSPMLAKKYEGQKLVDDNGIFVTEKLDGNRCIASYDGIKWNFTSRNGKPMYVDFDMSMCDKNRIYDGEVMSRAQTEASIKRTTNDLQTDVGQMFNETSGMINRHSTNKDLVYNIFDIVDSSLKYYQRRQELDELSYNCKQNNANDIRVLPVLQEGLDGITDRLDYITSTGGEGLMINLGSGLYQSKRTSDLLKFKQVQTMDMQVINLEYGTGKYEWCIGYLVCSITLKDGRTITCKVGTGLSDEQRERWAAYPGEILGKIVEIAYFAISQNSSTNGTNLYSLRFPRLKSIRNEKTNTSEY